MHAHDPYSRLQIALNECERRLAKPMDPVAEKEWKNRERNAREGLAALEKTRKPREELCTTEARNEAVFAFIDSGEAERFEPRS